MNGEFSPAFSSSKRLFRCSNSPRALELSTDRLAAFGHLFREHLLADLSALTMPGQNSAKSLSLAEPLSTWKARCPEKTGDARHQNPQLRHLG
jgi:hypothetical protein